MSLKTYVIGMLLATIVCWGAFGFVVFFVDPDRGWISIIAWYLTLGLALMGTFTLIGYRVRVAVSHGEELYANLGVSLRQGILLTVALLGVLFLQSLRMLNWWDGGLLVGFIILLEFFFLSRQ